MPKLDELLAEVRAKYPKYILKKRSDSLFMRFWGKNFATTIGNTTYTQDTFDSWPDEEKWLMIRHEATHTDDIHTWPFGPSVPWLNYLIFSFCYLLVLPVFWTMRAKFERNGYQESLVAMAALGRLQTPEQVEAAAQWAAKEFYVGSYFWMWRKKKAIAWAREVAAGAAAGRIQSRWRS